jgi:hypothetical protein
MADKKGLATALICSKTYHLMLLQIRACKRSEIYQEKPKHIFDCFSGMGNLIMQV